MACPGYTPEKDAPRGVTQRLRRFGGTNPFNGPMWRLCLADHRWDMRGGIFHQLPGGTIDVFPRDKEGRQHYQPPTGATVKHGIFPVKKYPVNGWILERWYPNHKWGSREWWESQVGSDGITPILGEYPVYGDYWMQAGPWPKMPELDDIETAIAQWEYEMNNNPVNMELFMKSVLATEQAEELKAYIAYEEELAAFVRAEIDPIWKSTTLAASRIRQESARSAGQTSHASL